VPGPAIRNVISPGTDPGRNLVAETKQTEGRHACGDGKSYPPPARRGIFDYTRNSLRQPAEVASVQDQRHPRDRSRCFAGDCFWYCWRCVHSYGTQACSLCGHRLCRPLLRKKTGTCLFAAQTECLCSELISCWFLLDACDSDVFCVR